jgi:hypothetical protein
MLLLYTGMFSIVLESKGREKKGRAGIYSQGMKCWSVFLSIRKDSSCWLVDWKTRPAATTHTETDSGSFYGNSVRSPRLNPKSSYICLK